MKIRRSIEKRMKDLEGSGRGCFYEREEEGQILFSTHLEEGRLDIYKWVRFWGGREDAKASIFRGCSHC